MSGETCGYLISRNRRCRRPAAAGEERCWQHRGKTPASTKRPKKRSARRRSGAQAQPVAVSSRAPDPPLAAWGGHAAGNTRGLTAHQVMRNYHGVAALREMTCDGALPHGARAVFAGGTCLALGHKLVERCSEDIDIVIAGCSGLGPDEHE